MTNRALLYEPKKKCGGKGEFQGLSQWVQLYKGTQIDFGYLTPYLMGFANAFYCTTAGRVCMHRFRFFISIWCSVSVECDSVPAYMMAPPAHAYYSLVKYACADFFIYIQCSASAGCDAFPPKYDGCDLRMRTTAGRVCAQEDWHPLLLPTPRPHLRKVEIAYKDIMFSYFVSLLIML